MSRNAQRPRRLVVDRPDQLAALTSPVRFELLERVGLLGPCGVAEVAEAMERTPDSLYYHLRRLEEVGLVVRDGTRETSTRPEALYRLPADELEVPRDSTGVAREATRKAIHAVLRLAGRELDEALDDPQVPDEGPRRRLYGRRMRGRLTLTALRELNRHIAAIETLFHEQAARRRRGGVSVALTLVLTPGNPEKDP